MGILNNEIQKRLDLKLSKLNKLRPLTIAAVKKLDEKFQIDMVYNSNAIEGNSLTLRETFLVINEGLTVKGKPLKDHLESKNHQSALEYLYELIEKDKKISISNHLIRTLHQLVVQETEKEFAGKYRNANVFITGADHTPPDAIEVPLLIEKLLRWYSKSSAHSIEKAAIFHHKLVNIHPFFDGNGRTARLVMNVLLMKEGFPLVIILKNDRKKYYSTLRKADLGAPEDFVRFIAQNTERSLDLYLKTLTPSSDKSKEKFQPLSKIAEKIPYSAKYLNLLARQGKLEAHKEKRNWLTSLEAVERYKKNRTRNK